MRHLTNAESADFYQPRERVRRARQQSAVASLELNAVVGDQAGEWQESGPRRFDELERKPRFARPGRTADEKRVRANEHRAGVDGRGVGHHAAGSRTVKRAPSTFGGSEPS